MSGYRERQDPREVAVELLRDAYARESQAMVQKSDAEIELGRAQALREAAWQNLGARTNLVRHLTALQTSLAGARERAARAVDAERTRAAVERLEAERAAFLKERGVEPGPALTEPPSDVSAELEQARAEVLAAEQQIRAADEQIAGARVALERALAALAAATRARVTAEAELRQLSG